MVNTEAFKAEIYNVVVSEYLKGSTKIETKGIIISWKKPSKDLSRKKLEVLAKEEAERVLIALCE
jgi:hypothetical protein